MLNRPQTHEGNKFHEPHEEIESLREDMNRTLVALVSQREDVAKQLTAEKKKFADQQREQSTLCRELNQIKSLSPSLMQRMKDMQAKAKRGHQFAKRRRTVAESLAQGYQHNDDQDI